MKLKLKIQVSEEAKNKGAEAKKREFEKKVNAMIQALSDFTEAYNKSMGKVWPAREAKVLKKAIADLQQTEAWFAESEAK